MAHIGTLGLFIIIVLFILSVHGERDEDGDSAAVEATVRQAKRLRLADNLLKNVEGACENGGLARDQKDEAGIKVLKQCVHSLEEYAKAVRAREASAYKTHGRYRRAFVQTYALLTSLLQKDKQKLYRFQETFRSNHTQAATYLKTQLDKIKETADKIGGVPGQESAAEPDAEPLTGQGGSAEPEAEPVADEATGSSLVQSAKATKTHALVHTRHTMLQKQKKFKEHKRVKTLSSKVRAQGGGAFMHARHARMKAKIHKLRSGNTVSHDHTSPIRWERALSKE